MHALVCLSISACRCQALQEQQSLVIAHVIWITSGTCVTWHISVYEGKERRENGVGLPACLVVLRSNGTPFWLLMFASTASGACV